MWENACVHNWLITIRIPKAATNSPRMDPDQYAWWVVSGQWIALIVCACWSCKAFIDCAKWIWVRLSGVWAQTTNTIWPINCYRIFPLQSEWVTFFMIWTLKRFFLSNLFKWKWKGWRRTLSTTYSHSILSVSGHCGWNIPFNWHVSRWQWDRLSIMIKFDSFHCA